MTTAAGIWHLDAATTCSTPATRAAPAPSTTPRPATPPAGCSKTRSSASCWPGARASPSSPTRSTSASSTTAPRAVHPGNRRAGRPVFVVNSFSKSWAMTGWRMGWLIYPRGMVDTFEKLIQFNTSGGQAFLQAGGVVALNEGEAFVRSLRRALPRRPRHRAGPAGGAGSRAHRAQQGVLLRDVRRGRHRRLAGVLQARRA